MEASKSFKRQVPDDEDGKRKTMKTVCAFVNGYGGWTLFGSWRSISGRAAMFTRFEGVRRLVR